MPKFMVYDDAGDDIELIKEFGEEGEYKTAKEAAEDFVWGCDEGCDKDFNVSVLDENGGITVFSATIRCETKVKVSEI